MELLLSIECLKITLIYCYTSDISSFIETYCNSHYWHNCKIEILNSITQFHIYLSKQDPSWAMSVVNNSMGDIKQKYILGLIRWDQQWSHRPTVLCCANSVQHYGSALRELNTKPHKCFVGNIMINLWWHIALEKTDIKIQSLEQSYMYLHPNYVCMYLQPAICLIFLSKKIVG